MPAERRFKPGTQLTSHRWLWLAIVANEYPNRMSSPLIAALPLYRGALKELGLENDLVAGSILGKRLAGRVPWSYRLDTPAEDALFDALKAWVLGLNLVHLEVGEPIIAKSYVVWPDSWTLEYATRLLRKIEEGGDNIEKLCRSESDLTLISVVNYKYETVERPERPYAHVEFETEEEYVQKAREYYREAVLWAEKQGYEREINKPELEKHLRWLAWRVVKRMKLKEIAGRDPGSFSVSTIDAALQGVKGVVEHGVPTTTIWKQGKRERTISLRGKNLNFQLHSVR